MKRCGLASIVLSMVLACSHQAWADVKVRDDNLRNKIIEQLETADTSVRKNQKTQIDQSTGNRGKGSKAYGAESAGANDNMKRRNYLSMTGKTATTYDKTTLPKNFICDSGGSTPSSGCNGFSGTESGAKSADIRKALKVDYSTSGALNDIANLTRQEEEKRAQEIAVYQAMLEEAYVQAAKRFETIQELMNDIDDADTTKDPKAIWDLQARIQAEQMMLQNEQIKITTLGQLQKSAADMYAQRMQEISKFRKAPDSTSNSVATNGALSLARGAIATANQGIIAAVDAAWEDAKAK